VLAVLSTGVLLVALTGEDGGDEGDDGVSVHFERVGWVFGFEEGFR
jgi:hypothetical protein